jgi:hypothetical protein
VSETVGARASADEVDLQHQHVTPVDVSTQESADEVHVDLQHLHAIASAVPPLRRSVDKKAIVLCLWHVLRVFLLPSCHPDVLSLTRRGE